MKYRTCELNDDWARVLHGFRMFYGEKVNDNGSLERGIFMSLAEFLPYYQGGWRSTAEINCLAVDALKREE